MGSQDFIQLPHVDNSEPIPDDHTRESGFEALETQCVTQNAKVIDETNGEAACGAFHDSSSENMTTDIERDAVNNIHNKLVDIEMAESVAVVDAVVTSISSVNTESGSLAVQSGIILTEHQIDEPLVSSQEIGNAPKSGVKRQRTTVDEDQPSVYVVYNSLTRESNRKLEELLQQWSLWHAKNCALTNDPNTVIESGEKTYYPALHVGLDKPSQVSFWVDNQTKTQSDNEFTPLDGTSVPLYDRGYSLALTSGVGSSSLDGVVEKFDASRCFNCSSYSHALKDCPKPRDNAAVNSARKQLNSRRNQNANSRNSSRYYQSSSGGKYEGLMPGVLDPETRQLLGLREFDPPPWLTRMREIGYPPGYLDPDEDQPSGITIFGEEPDKEEGEEGEILGTTSIEVIKKKSVEFPGMNAPIPENADEILWGGVGSTNSSFSRDRSHRRHNNSSDNPGRVGYHESRWSKDLDDDRPPGCDPWTSPSLANHLRRYGDYDRDSSYSSGSRSDRYGEYDRDSSYTGRSSTAWSSQFSRSSSEKGTRSPSAQDEYSKHRSSTAWSAQFSGSGSDKGRKSPSAQDEPSKHGRYAYPYSPPR